MHGDRKFVVNLFVAEKNAFVTCCMDEQLKNILGFCIAKQSDLKVRAGSYVNFQLSGYCLTFQYCRLIYLERYDEGQPIDQPLVYKVNVTLPDDEDHHGDTRKNIKFSGQFHYEKRINYSYGILSFDDKRGTRCVQIGIFNKNLRLNSLGQSKKGDSEDIIGKFADGQIDP